MLPRQDQHFSASLATETIAVPCRRRLLQQDLPLQVQTSKCFKTATGQRLCRCCWDPMPSGIIGGVGLSKRSSNFCEDFSCLQMIRRLRVTTVLWPRSPALMAATAPPCAWKRSITGHTQSAWSGSFEKEARTSMKHGTHLEVDRGVFGLSPVHLRV